MENDINNDSAQENEDQPHRGLTGLGQKIIGEVEALAGVVNADPLAQAEGEFNVEVGTVREELEEGLDKDERT